MIGYIAANGGLNGFALNLSELISKLKPTANYFGKLNEESLAYLETIISPENNNVKLSVSSLPLRIGVRQIDIAAYPSRPFYMLDFNEHKIEDRVLGRFQDHNPPLNEVQQEMQKEKDKIQSGMPLKITITRNLIEDPEKLILEEIIDKEGNSLNKNFFTLQVQSMSEIDNFWLDSGIFSLNIHNSKVN